MKTVLLLGAAGRDFHNFNVFFRQNLDYRVSRFYRHPDPRHCRPSLPARAVRTFVRGWYPDH
jgi:hypothetical protein